MVCFGVETSSLLTQKHTSRLYLPRILNVAHTSQKVGRALYQCSHLAIIHCLQSTLRSLTGSQGLLLPHCSDKYKLWVPTLSTVWIRTRRQTSARSQATQATFTSWQSLSHSQELNRAMIGWRNKWLIAIVTMAMPLSHFHFSVKALAKGIINISFPSEPYLLRSEKFVYTYDICSINMSVECEKNT